MAEIICKRCRATDYVKNGMVRGLQRYRCRVCGCNFTVTKPRGKPAAVKALATLLYALGNMSFRGIARLLAVSDVAVRKWIRAEALKLPEPEVPADVKLVMLDELHNFLKKRPKGFDFGERLILSSGELYPGLWVGVMVQPAKSTSTKSGSKAEHS